MQEHDEIRFVDFVGKKRVVKEVLADKRVIITPRDHPLAAKKHLIPKDLERHPFIMHEKGSAPRRAIEAFIRKSGISVKIPLALSRNRAIKRAVEEGIGIALISRKVANEEIRANRLKAINLRDPSMKRKFFLVHHKDKYMSESLRLLMDVVFEWRSEYSKQLK